MKPALSHAVLFGFLLCLEVVLHSSSSSVCEHTVLSNDSLALEVAQSYYPEAIPDKITPDEAEKLVIRLNNLVDKYIKEAINNKTIGIDMDSIPALVREGKYWVQIVPISVVGKRLAMLNLLGVGRGEGIWRKRFYSTSDGGIQNCRCFIDLKKEEVILIDCNGFG